jgi:hypothetical protein
MDNINIIWKTIVGHFNADPENIYNIQIDYMNEYRVRYTQEDFTLIPIFLYIIKRLIQDFMLKKV